MGAFLYLLLFCVLSDIIIFVLKLFRLSFVKKALFKGITVVIVLALTLSTVIYGINNAKEIDHLSYEIKLENFATVFNAG